MPMPPDLAARAERLEWILLDVDGVLTDGTIYMDSRSEAFKAFNVKDGLGIKMARDAGLKVGILSARRSGALERRANQLGIDALMMGCEQKSEAFDEFLARYATTPGRIAYMGDDLNDLTVLARSGLSYAPADAVEQVKAVVHLVLSAPGGRGAVRQMVEHVLDARGDLKAALAAYSLEQ